MIQKRALRTSPALTHFLTQIWVKSSTYLLQCCTLFCTQNSICREESVKCFETLIPNYPFQKLNHSNENQQPKTELAVISELKIQPKAPIISSDKNVSVISELSELCSFSESLSTEVEKRDDDNSEVTQRLQREMSPKRAASVLLLEWRSCR